MTGISRRRRPACGFLVGSLEQEFQLKQRPGIGIGIQTVGVETGIVGTVIIMEVAEKSPGTIRCGSRSRKIEIPALLLDSHFPDLGDGRTAGIDLGVVPVDDARKLGPAGFAAELLPRVSCYDTGSLGRNTEIVGEIAHPANANNVNAGGH